MTELLLVFAAGFVVFFIALVRYSGGPEDFPREAPRWAPIAFAIFTLVGAVALAIVAIDAIFRPEVPWVSGAARILALCLGFTAGYVTFRRFRLRGRRDDGSNAS